MGGVVEFVEDLFLDGSRVDHAAGALGFGYDDGAIFLYFGDRESDIRKTGDIFASRVGVISAGYLGAALKQMAGQHTDGHFVPIICRPTEMLHERAKGECRIGDPSGHDDVRVKSEGVRDRLRAEIYVRGQNLRVRQVQRCFIPPLLGAQAANVFPQIVAVDYGNAEALNAEFLGEFVQPARRAHGIGAAEITNNGNAARDAALQHRADETREVGRVPLFGIATAFSLGDCQRALRQGLVKQCRRPAGPDQRVRHRAAHIHPVDRKPGGVPDMHASCAHRNILPGRLRIAAIAKS